MKKRQRTVDKTVGRFVQHLIKNLARVNLRAHLSNGQVEEELRRIIAHVADSAKCVNLLLDHVKRDYAGTVNVYQDPQLLLDVFADELIRERLAAETSFGVAEFASEEQGEILLLRDHGGEQYSLTVDPLDGSSRIRVNGTVGTIIGIHRRPILSGKPARENLVAAMYIVFGPLTTLTYTTGDGVHEFVLDPTGNFVLSQENIQMKNKGSIYSPGGQRTAWLDAHRDFIGYLEARDYKLRYSGCLVADFHQLLIEGGGLFCYPALKKTPEGKLRLLVEAQPLAFIVEQAGGAATNGHQNILDLVAQSVAQCVPLYIGSKFEVSEAGEFLRKTTRPRSTAIADSHLDD
ncbi:MAG TPA: class 1 fructose-bisphosphatase [Verrucomicrobiae bacterium]|jgi:fructose-1,6-bisphosphatase I|nr:class 1 fructose-bisphosphatase [Verrucomicrobiae bacterium]